MGAEKISALPAVPGAQLTDFFASVQGGVTSKETLQQVLTLFNANIQIAQAQVTNLVADLAAIQASIPSLPVSLTNGGTGKALTAANGGVIYSDADSFEVLAPTATAGKVLQSGSSAAPSWSTPTYPSASGTAGKLLISDGTNNIYSTPTYPNASATANTLIRSDGTNYVASTLQVPNTTAIAESIRTGSSANILISIAAVHFENIQVFTSNGTFNVPSDVSRVFAIAVGGGGGGGGGSAGTVGSGGGSGSLSAGIVTVTPGGTVAVTVGTGGNGGAASNSGNAGNDSSFGASVVGKGGGLGIVGGGTAASGPGGVAGTGTITTVGNPGQGGGSIATCLSGMGGGSPMFGGGGAATTGIGGNGGTNTGGGGAGGRNANAGGNGGSGVVVVFY